MGNKEFKEEFKNRLYRFVLRLLKFVGTLPKNEVTRVIIDQIIRSGTSILANYIEAQASSSRREFANFLRHSLKSSNETEVWLELLRDTSNGDKEELAYLLKELDEIARIFASIIIKLRGGKNNF